MASTPPPVPTRSKMLGDDGLATRPWIAWFTTLGQLFGFNQTIQAAGVSLPQETALNFLAPFTVTDNPANGSTDVGLALVLPFKVQFGISDPAAIGGNAATVPVVFVTPFSTPPVVLCGPDNTPRVGAEPFDCYPSDISVTGFTANFNCSVPTGGGGGIILNVVHANWIAIA